jgi:hypothetical protein
MANALARHGAPSYSLAYRFGGAAPTAPPRRTPGRFGLVLHTAKESVTKELPASLAAYSPALLTHAVSAALDESALGAQVQQWTDRLGVSVKPSTLAMVVTSAVAVAAPSRAWRKNATLVLLGFLHNKIHQPAASVPALISRLLTPG